MNLKGNYLEVTILGVEGNDFATWLEHELNIRAWKPGEVCWRANKEATSHPGGLFVFSS